jgi:hypothetical protein
MPNNESAGLKNDTDITWSNQQLIYLRKIKPTSQPELQQTDEGKPSHHLFGLLSRICSNLRRMINYGRRQR